MPTIPCATKLNSCPPCNDDPIANFSAEAIDVDRVLSVDFYVPTDLTTINSPVLSPPPTLLNVPFFQYSCKGWCYSDISQYDADDCAKRQNLECLDAANQCSVIQDGLCLPFPLTRFLNTEQTAAYTCPDGLIYYFTVPAGTIYGQSQALANAVALSVARFRAQQVHFCLNANSFCTCLGSFATYDFTLSGGFEPFLWQVIGGPLPDGMSLSAHTGRTVKLRGIPVTPGHNSFTLLVTDALGGQMSKSISWRILSITTATLPQFTQGTPYSYVLQATGGGGNYSWKLVGGGLPAGLSLADNGTISGTPTGSSAAPFSVQLTDKDCA